MFKMFKTNYVRYKIYNVSINMQCYLNIIYTFERETKIQKPNKHIL